MTIRQAVKNINARALKCPRCGKPLYGQPDVKCACPERFYKGKIGMKYSLFRWVNNIPLPYYGRGLAFDILADYFGGKDYVPENLIEPMADWIEPRTGKRVWYLSSGEITLWLLKSKSPTGGGG